MRRAILALAGLLALVAACGSGDFGAARAPNIPSPAQGDVVVRAESNLVFQPEEVTATAGDVSVVLTNDDRQVHTFTIEGREDELLLRAEGGETVEGSIELEPGEYVFYCDVPGHRAGGMEGTLTVEDG